MCGIAGTIQTDGRAATPEALDAMLLALHHRGPDGCGALINGPLAIGMRRLAIIDVVGGQQPIWNESETMAIVCNGEIYNYAGLRTELEKRGHRFRTHSDVEVILHLYEDEGPECFKRLNGMFGAAIADMRARRLVLARDPFGQKPLYVWRAAGRVAFASELKALAALPGFRRQINEEALAAFLQFRYVPAPLAIYEDVEKLRPGSYATIDHHGNMQTERYWQIDLRANRQERKNGADFLEVFGKSVDRHLMSERPLGVFLSGGIDSGAVLASMHCMGHRNIHTYTVGFEDFPDSEFANARRMAEHFGSSHHEVTLSADQFWSSLDCVLRAADEPLADMTMVPLYHLAQEAGRELVVVLSGEGSDELLGGYPGMETLLRRLTFLNRMRSLLQCAHTLGGWMLPTGQRARLARAAGSHASYLAQKRYSMTEIFDEEFRRRGENGARAPHVLEPLENYYQEREGWHGVELYQGAQIEWWLADDLLHKADRMTMAHSLELRCPFLDTVFADYCTKLRLEEKVRDAAAEPTRKVALKRAFAEVLPEGIAYQPKKGFTLPIYRWLASKFRIPARNEIVREDGFAATLFGPEIRTEICERAAAGVVAAQHQAWSLIVLNKWADQCL